MIHLTIDGKPVEVEKGTTILHAARKAGIEIPTLYRRLASGWLLPFVCG